MRVNETFLSLQGEGFFTGTPAFFLRFSGCNLQCPFCDTQHQSFTEMTEEEIVREACRHKPRHIVITGGEPALQLTQSLVDKLHEAGFFIQVETNGTLSLPEGIDWVTVSPKTDPPTPFRGRSIDELKILYMGKDTDPDTILKSLPLGREGGGLPRLYLQPLDTGDTERNRIILRETIDYIMQHPKWSLSLQTHKLLGIK
ncbi:MAG: radical SAM protein [Bacteroidaceae bacterium]|nr:radical SAM protein [Bacteroidaceae bacterium]